MTIKCKMCGGDVQFNPGDTYGQCENCGRTSTIPKADDEQKLNRYNRANHLRRQGEFEKAAAAYERILEEDDTDAEAHWGAALSRYGIDYVEDPATGKQVPTCNRVQLVSLLADGDYLAAVKYAPDATSRNLYEEQAKEIAEIQKKILSISANEKPYDVFICYKETDENGQRTRDSVLAQEIYYQLIHEGWKVFFSRITLENRLGQEYEPYIFAALNSARVMLLIGTKPEYINAVWVRNEWSRYLHLMKNDRKRLLIPCYRDMDPYDLPEELGNLQGQDMSKLGFMQDILHGIRKVLDEWKGDTGARPAERKAADIPFTPGAESLLKRAQLYMEDGDFTKAAEYADKALDADPENAAAYAAKVCIAFGLRREADLAELPFLFEDHADWKKALRFADPKQKAAYEGYTAKVRERVNRQIRDYTYDCAIETAISPDPVSRSMVDGEIAFYRKSCDFSSGTRANGERRKNSEENRAAFQRAASGGNPGNMNDGNLTTAAEIFREIGDVEGLTRADQCLRLAEAARERKKITSGEEGYRLAVRYAAAEALQADGKYRAAARKFRRLKDYRDSRKLARECRRLGRRKLTFGQVIGMILHMLAAGVLMISIIEYIQERTYIRQWDIFNVYFAWLFAISILIWIFDGRKKALKIFKQTGISLAAVLIGGLILDQMFSGSNALLPVIVSECVIHLLTAFI